MPSYEVIGKLGEGGMGAVFHARMISAGVEQEVALKRISAEYAENSEADAQLVAEARVLALLRHRNIVRLLDLGRNDEGRYIVMEFVKGSDLSFLLRRGLLPIPLVLYIAGEIARALDYAHEFAAEGRALGLVHRDLSPHNVLVSRDGEVKVSDFGIAKATAISTHSGSVKGKLVYMAPEQALGERLDGRADLFAFGVMLYEMLAGRRPFGGATDRERLAQLLRCKPVPIVDPDVPPALAALAMRLLARAPDDRPASAKEVLAEIVAMKEYPLDGEERLTAYVRDELGPRAEVTPEKLAALTRGARTKRRARLALVPLAIGATVSVMTAVVVWWPELSGESASREREAGAWSDAAIFESARRSEDPLEEPEARTEIPRGIDAESGVAIADAALPDAAHPDAVPLAASSTGFGVPLPATNELDLAVAYADAELRAHGVFEDATLAGIIARFPRRGAEGSVEALEFAFSSPVNKRCVVVVYGGPEVLLWQTQERCVEPALAAPSCVLGDLTAHVAKEAPRSGVKGVRAMSLLVPGHWHVRGMSSRMMLVEDGCGGDIESTSDPWPSVPWGPYLTGELTVALTAAEETARRFSFSAELAGLRIKRSSSGATKALEVFFRPALADLCIVVTVGADDLLGEERDLKMCPPRTSGKPTCTVDEAVSRLSEAAGPRAKLREIVLERTANGVYWTVPDSGVSVLDACSR